MGPPRRQGNRPIRAGRPDGIPRRSASRRRFDDEEQRFVTLGLLEGNPVSLVHTVRVDQEVLDWFKAQGPGYQARMNAVLRAFRDASTRT